MKFEKLKKYIDQVVLEEKTPMVDCIVCREHEEIFRYRAGMRDKENGIPLDGTELFLIFSMTKMLTCTAALQLMEQGKFSLDDPVSKYLPAFSEMKISESRMEDDGLKKAAKGVEIETKAEISASGKAKTPITIKHLFTMSAGLDYDGGAECIQKCIREGKSSTRDIVNAMSGIILGFEPGTRFRYSFCHDVLGGLIEIWSGQKLGVYMKEHIFEPLGMNDTFFGISKEQEKISRMATLYTYNDDGEVERLPLINRYNLTEEYESGGAGLMSSAKDYATFLDTMACGGVSKDGRRILNQETIALMSKNYLDEVQLIDFQDAIKGYGYGLGVRTHIDKKASGSISPIGEFGWDGAAGSFSMVDTKNKLSITLIQHVHRWDRKVHETVRNIVYSCLDGEVEL